MHGKVDTALAPAGCVAQRETNGCDGCAFESDRQCGPDRPCFAYERPDGCRAIFVRVEPVAALRPSGLVDVLRMLIEHLRQYIVDTGGCDHGVGICVCGLKADLATAEAMLAQVEAAA